MQIFPAIDLRGGQVVRLYQGDYDQETVYAQDPCAVARDFHRRRCRIPPCGGPGRRQGRHPGQL